MFRVEKDSLGSLNVPSDVLYGIQTCRAIENFDLSGQTLNNRPELLSSLAMVKKAAAITNQKIGTIPDHIGNLIQQVCDEIVAGKWHDQFPVDLLQGGAGTSTNMNMNEVIANRCLQLSNYDLGQYEYVHPNDHVNCSQSTNDAYATALRISIFKDIERLRNALLGLGGVFEEKAQQFTGIEKLGRTQLQDAVPMTVDAELRAYAATLQEDAERAVEISNLFLEVNLGGTAIGSSVGANPEYLRHIISNLKNVTGLDIKAGANLYEASWDMGAFVLCSGLLKRIAAKLSKISNDFRLLSSGPFGGIGEYILPAKQPGSSIMPGKVNPVIPEALNQICFKVFGADTVVTFAAEGGQLQLNAFEPVIYQAISESIELLINGIMMFKKHCLEDLEISGWNSQENLRRSMALATKLVPISGYEEAANMAKEASELKLPFTAYLSKHHPHLLVHVKG